jgi:hypothetical protein
MQAKLTADSIRHDEISDDFRRVASELRDRARICRSFKETRYRFSAWRAGTKPYLSYWPAKQHRLAKSIPRNRFPGSINIYKYGLWIPPFPPMPGQNLFW